MILLIGSEGQLGTTLKKVLGDEAIALTLAEADITKLETLLPHFKSLKFETVINCAAYTAVDKAEDEKEIAYAINAQGTLNLASLCEQYQKTLIHISTDYVFSGESAQPLSEEAETFPQSVYGQSKLEGEKLLAQTSCKYHIVRTSWLYSKDHPSFLKTMLQLGAAKSQINVVDDQIGSPTWVFDLAFFLIELERKKDHLLSGQIFHYSNEGQCSWYEFASEIMKLATLSCQVNPIPSVAYPTKAKRPHYSLLSKAKVKKTFLIEIPHWKESLEKALLG